jgi:hypothetical protein
MTRSALLCLLVAGMIVCEPARLALAGSNELAQTEDAAAPAAPTVPAAETLLMLVRSTISALNQANSTGNYTVLRDLGSPSLQTTSAAELGLAFTDLRRRTVDLSASLILTPELTESPVVGADGVLKLAGHFPTKPLRITFAMTFQPVAGLWRLHGLSVQAVPAP